MKHRQAYAVSTSKLIRKYETAKNPVTKSVYRDIIGNRVDRLELFRLNYLEKEK